MCGNFFTHEIKLIQYRTRELKVSEDNYRTLFNNMLEGFAFKKRKSYW